MDYDYSQDLPAPGHNILAELAAVADDALAAEKEVERIEADLKRAKQKYNDLVQKTLPELMEAAGQKTCTSAKGHQLKLVDVLRASISKERVPEAHKWLRDHDLGSIIKLELKAQFGKNEGDKAKEALKALKKFNKEAEAKEAVHNQTLLATLRELLAEGEDVPLDLFGAVVQKEVKIGLDTDT